MVLHRISKATRLGDLPPSIGAIKIDLLALYKFVDALGGYMNVIFNGNWHQVAKILGLAYEHHEAAKEVYKEYISMIKVYYEEAKRVQGGPDDVAGNGRDAAGIQGPQVDAQFDARVPEMQEETPKKNSKTAKGDTFMEDANSGSKYANAVEGMYASSSDDFEIITWRWNHEASGTWH